MRATALLTVSLPSSLARQVKKVSREEARTKSELLREALRLYIDTREARRAVAREHLGHLVAHIRARNRAVKPGVVRTAIRRAIEESRAAERGKRGRAAP
jgi:metal-responsive CopG/Arc/MetJ family transcriptional regulator